MIRTKQYFYLFMIMYPKQVLWYQRFMKNTKMKMGSFILHTMEKIPLEQGSLVKSGVNRQDKN